MKKLLLLWFTLLLGGMLSAQVNTEGAFGGTENDSITFVSPLSAGNGFLIMGYTNSFTPDPEIFIMKTDLAGNPLWAKNFFLNNTQNEPVAICEGNDGGVIVVFANNGINEVFIAKYNETSGAFDWAKRNAVFINKKAAYDLLPVDSNNDGTGDGYVISIVSTDGNNRGQLLKVDNNGEVTHKQSEDLWDVDVTDLMIANDNRLLAAGRRNGGDEVVMMELNYNDLSVVDAGTHTYLSTVRESNTAKVDYVKMAQSADGSIVMIAHHSDPSMNDVGRIIIKTDADGTNPTTYEYGLEGVDDFYLTDVGATESGFIFAGYTGSGYANSFGQRDIIFVRTDLNMELEKASIFGGELDDAARFVFENDDNSVSIFANSNSFSSGNSNDFYIIKTADNATALCNEQAVAFSIQVADVQVVANGTMFNTTDNVSAATDLTDNYEFKDITLTAYCACTIDLSFETSGTGCTGEPIMFSNPGEGLGYEWDFGDGALDSIMRDGTIYVPYATPGIKYVTLDVPNNSCIKSATKAIIIYESPEVDITYSSDDNDCEGKPFTFTNNGSSGSEFIYSWDFGNGATPRESKEEIAHGIIYKEGTEEAVVTLTVANNRCRTTDTETIALNTKATPDFETTAGQCTDEMVDFVYTGTQADTDLVFAWDFADGTGGSDVANPADVVYDAKGVKSVLLTVTTPDGCTDTVRKEFSIYQTPEISDVSATGGSEFCAESLVDFEATVADSDDSQWNYTWDLGQNAVPSESTEMAPVGVVYEKAAEVEVVLTVNDEHCSASETVTITINEKPVADFSSSESMCTGDSLIFINMGTEGISYEWTFGEGASADQSVENPEPVIYSTPGVKQVQLIVENASCADTSVQAITVYRTPVVAFSTDAPQCVGNTVVFTNEGDSNKELTFTWDFGADALDQTAANENAEIRYASEGDKTIRLTVNSDYCSAFAEETIFINALPIPVVIADTTICPDTELEIGGDAVPANTYVWNASDESILSDVASANPTAMPVAEFTVYTVTVTDENGCVNTDSVNITMLPALKALVGVDEEICRNDSIQIGAYPIEGIVYEWELADGISDLEIANPIVKPEFTATYTLNVSYENKPECASVSDQVRVIVNQLPNVVATDYMLKDTTDIALGSSVQLIATGAVQYEWDPSEGLTNAGIDDPVASPEDSTMYTVKGTDIHGCINYDSVLVNVIVPTTWIPAAFSPNGDDLNDVFIIRATETVSFNLQIFTRSGEQVYQSGDQYEGWDGRNQGTGEELPQGAYVYYTKGELTDGEMFEEKGIINLVR